MCRGLQKVAARLREFFALPAEADIVPKGRVLAGCSFSVLQKNGKFLAFRCTHAGTTYGSTNVSDGVCNARWG